MKYVLSDIHGNLDTWNSIKEQIHMTKDDEMFILGDVIDRQPYGIAILKEIIATANMHMLLGNHEYMMLNALDMPCSNDDAELDDSAKERKKLWYYNGGEVTHKAFRKLSADEKSRIVKYLQALPLDFEVESGETKYILVHANWCRTYETFNPDEPERTKYFAVWDRDHIDITLKMLAASGNNHILVIGHTPTLHFAEKKNEWPNDKDQLSVFKLKNLLAVDCGAAYPDYGGRLACIRLDDMKVFYST